MAELIPSYTFTDFKKLKPDQLRRLKCAEITFNSEYLFTFIRPNTDFTKQTCENMGALSNSIGGLALEEVKELIKV